MSDQHLDEQISGTLHAVAESVPVRDRLAAIHAEPSRFVRGPVLVGAVAFVAGIVIIGGVLLALRGSTNEPADPAAPSVTTLAASSTTSTMPSALRSEIALGGAADGFGAVEQTLDRARDRWAAGHPEEYGYRLDIDCNCAEAGSSWSRVFEDDVAPGTVTVETLFNRITAAIEEQPEAVEVEFSATDGHPMAYRVTTASGEFSVAVAEFHPITRDPSPFDGTWRFVEGTVDGTTFKSPANRGLSLTLLRGGAQYPTDCNQTDHRVDIHRSSFGLGGGSTTLVGCDTSPETALFQEAFGRSDSIQLNGVDLVLGGDGVSLRFTPPQQPDDFGDLQLTAAGERLSFEIPDERERTATYIITSQIETPDRDVRYLLTAETAGLETTASWQRWQGEPDESAPTVTGPGPDTIVVPDDIWVGDHALCSPYWEPDQFCFTLRVRPPSAPWVVTAGEAGVVLHDADGTSEILSTESATIAFYVDGRLVFQPTTGPDRIVITDLADGHSEEIPHQPDEALLDVAEFDGTVQALTTHSSGTYLVDIDTADRRRIAAPATEARFTGATLILRTGNSFSAVRADGSTLWDRVLDPEALVTPDQEGQLRADIFTTLNNDAGDGPYFQYVQTELIDSATGETVASYEWEVAIPFEGHEIGERCVRSEIKAGLLLCPQPDGRMVTLPTGGDGGGSGDSHTLTSGATTATFARP